MREIRSELDRINRTTWSTADRLDDFAAREGPLDEGEVAVLRRIAAEAAGQPILDIGVGGGRTVPLLLALSDDYVGVDYLEELVTLTRSRFPGVRIEHADARELAAFAGGTFGLVYFSTNGIDGVGHDDRHAILAEIHRVLRPRGLFAFSTHNLDHPFTGRAPWNHRWFRCRPRKAAHRAARLPKRTRAYLRARGLTIRGNGWATLVDPAYDFGMLTHFVRLTEAFRELEEAGFEAEIAAYDTFGAELGADAETSKTFWFHLVARRP